MIRKLMVRRTRARPRLWTTTKKSRLVKQTWQRLRIEANLWNRVRTGSSLDQVDVRGAVNRERVDVVEVVDGREAGRALHEECGWVKGMTGRKEERKHAPDETFVCLIYRRLAGAACYPVHAPMT